MTTPASLPSPLLPINAPDAGLETVGGKGANLIKLANAGFPVPNGFMIPTMAYRQFVEENDLMPQIQEGLQHIDFTSPQDLAGAAASIRPLFSNGIVSPGLKAALEIGWRWLGRHPVAVRSSATAEDLPELSFAGQQDTFLNVVGDQALQQAVVDCWREIGASGGVCCALIGQRKHAFGHGDGGDQVVVVGPRRGSPPAAAVRSGMAVSASTRD